MTDRTVAALKFGKLAVLAITAVAVLSDAIETWREL